MAGKDSGWVEPVRKLAAVAIYLAVIYEVRKPSGAMDWARRYRPLVNGSVHAKPDGMTTVLRRCFDQLSAGIEWTGSRDALAAGLCALNQW